MKKRYYYLLFFCMMLASVTAVAEFYVLSTKSPPIENYVDINRSPVISPDYTQTVIPPNIAPLNFMVNEKASRYFVRIYSEKSPSIDLFSSTGKIVIPIRSWKKLLNTNPGKKLYFDIYILDQKNQWQKFLPITNTIAMENIDPFIAYRKIYPVHGSWRQMGIYQRDLQAYNEKRIFDNRFHEGVCINCHTFLNNKTQKMFIGTRSAKYKSNALLAQNSDLSKIDAKFGYTSWHPSGKLAAYSVNKVHQFFHTAQSEVRGVIDMDSYLAYYILDSQKVKTSPMIAKKDRLESYPCWSPDGKHLYFSSAPMLWTDRDRIPPESYDQVKYDLMRISYDIEKDRWGTLETVLSAEDTGKSALQPRISPDGRWLIFTMCNYGSFPVYHETSDLYLLDLREAQRTGRFEYRRLNINSEKSESWHSFSSNSRWLAFSSKRRNGVFTRIYFSYIDEDGRLHKPILMPQKDPQFYDYTLKTYSVPELIAEPVRTTPEDFGRVVRAKANIPVDIPVTMATPKAGKISPTEPWQERE